MRVGTAVVPIAPVGTGIVLAGMVTEGLNLVERLVLLPLNLGEAIVSTSLTAASTTVDILSQMNGTSEPSFSLAEFVTLVRREWSSPVMADRLPAEKSSALAVAKAIIAWAALQLSTKEYHKSRWRENMIEISEEEWNGGAPTPSAESFSTYSHSRDDSRVSHTTTSRDRDSRVFVKEDILLPEHSGQIISADIGHRLEQEGESAASSYDDSIPPLRLEHVRLNLRRFSKMVLGGYGGAALTFFGIPFPQKHKESKANDETTREEEEEVLAQLVQDADEDEVEAAAKGSSFHKDNVPPPAPSWWDVLWGKHDQEIFEGFATSLEKSPSHALKISAIAGDDSRMPRFWVLTDHNRKQIVLVVRGTMSLNELAVVCP